MRTKRAFAIVALAALTSSFAASCADLPAIPADKCGNRVVDGNEDCDTFGNGIGTACRPATDRVAACRFDCNFAAGHFCPGGFGCGADDVCRAPSGSFATATTIPTTVEQVVVADFDGDRHQDVVTQGATGVRVHFFDHTSTNLLTLTDTTPLPITRGRIVGGSLTSDGLSSLTVVDTGLAQVYEKGIKRDRVVGGGLNVWRSQPNRSLLPTIYPSFPIVRSDTAKTPVKDAIVLSGKGTSFHAGQDLFIIADTGSGSYELAYLEISTTGTPRSFPMLPLAVGPSSLAGLPTVGPLPLAPVFQECDSMVIAPLNSATVTAIPLCAAGADMNGTPFFVPNVLDQTQIGLMGKSAPIITVKLPKGSPLTVAGRAFIADANGDKLNDILVSVGPFMVGKDAYFPLAAAYAIGNGHFTSAQDPSKPVQDDQMSFYGGGLALIAQGKGPQWIPPTGGPVLDVGYIDSDDTLDWVTPTGIRFGAPDTLPFSLPSSAPWKEARIMDTNGNGAKDVVAISPGGVDFYNGTNFVLMNHQANSFDGAPSHMIIADLDGDLALDIAVSVSGDSVSQAETLPSDALYVQFGTFGGFPQAPTLAGRAPPISYMDPAYISWLRGAPDFIASIAAVSKINGQLYAVAIQGSSSRTLTSPFTLATVDGLGRGAAFDAVVGTFLPDNRDGTSRTALATIAIDTLDSSVMGSYKGQLWAAPVTGAAQFDATRLIPTPVKYEVPLDPGQLTGSRVVAVDLDPPSAGGIDEALVFVPAVKKGTLPGTFFVNALDAKNKQWSIRGTPNAFDAIPTTRTFPLAVSTADIDGNGSLDVLVFGGDGATGVFAKVMFNDLTGSLDYAQAVLVNLPPGTAAAAPLNATAGVGATILALTPDGVVIVPTLPNDPRHFGPPGNCVGKMRVNCAVAFNKSVASSTLVDMRAADLDGDGVEDLIVASQTGLSLYRQEAVKP